MVAFKTPVDIGNRGLQHCGGRRIDPLLGFAENSKSASEVSFCYDKLREAELRGNVWSFATRRTVIRPVDIGTMLLTPALWVESTTYFVGSIVSDASNNLWISRTPNNLGNDPQNSLTWEPYFGPLTVSLYASNSYFAGELVYTAAGDGTARIYLSLQSGNQDDPSVATAWNATAVYSKNQVVTYLGNTYMSLIDLNKAQVPLSTLLPWNIATSYNLGDVVSTSDGLYYSSLGSGNTGFDPTTDLGVHWLLQGLTPWTRTFVGGSGSVKWLQIGGAEFPVGVGLATMNITYPLGAGPASQDSSRNIFHLPAGFLRIAPQNPKAAPVSYLGAAGGDTYNDWLFEGGFLVSSEINPIPLRFVANITDVSRMDPMFCEGLAARVGMEVCEPVTQSTAKLGVIAKIYDEWMSRAKAQNAIEQGWEDPPVDDFIACRA